MRRIVTFLVDSGPITVLALLAGCGSFTHIRQTAIEHGQKGWMATAVAICVDLVCLVAARERQRDRKAGRGAGWPTTVLVGGCGLSLAANLDQAQPDVWGWVTAGVPCTAFITATALLERRGTHRPAGGVSEVREAPALVTAPQFPPSPVEAESAVPKKPRPSRPPRRQTKDDDILTRARQVAEAYREKHEKSISRDVLKTELGISTNRATVLLRELKAAGV